MKTMQSSRPSRLCVGIHAMLGLALCLPALPAAAQGFLEEIIVTARKREENLQKVPLSVTAVDTESIEQLQLRDLDDIARFVPGLSFSSAFGRVTERPVVRGLSSILAGTQIGVGSGAAYFINGVYFPGDVQSLDVNEIERVEVIRGPQSALYGRNTYSGAINFVTKRPTEEPTGRVRISPASDGENNFNASYSGRVTEELGVRASLRSYEYDGEWTNLVTGETVGDEQTRSGSLSLDYEQERFRIRLWNSYQEDRDGTRPFFQQPAGENNCFPEFSAASGERTGRNLYFCGAIRERPIALNDAPFTGTPEQLTQLIRDLGHGPVATTRPDGTPGTPYPDFGETTSLFGVPASTFTRATNNTGDGVRFSGLERDQFISSLRVDFSLPAEHDLIFSFGYHKEDWLEGADQDHSPVNIVDCEDDNPLRLVSRGPPPTFERLRPLEPSQPRPGFVAFPGCGPTSMSFDALSSSDSERKREDYSVELRLESPEINQFRYRLGLFYYDEDLEQIDIDFDERAQGYTIQDNELNDQAVFGALEYDFMDRFTLTAELRYQDEEREVIDFVTDTDPDERPDPDGAGPMPDPADAYDGSVALLQKGSWSAFTWRATLDYELDQDTTLYVVQAKGVKPGGFNGTTGARVGVPQYEEEEALTWEIGAKRLWADRRILTNVALYYSDLDGLQGTEPVRTASGGTDSIVQNKGEGRVFGLELEGRWLATEFLDFGLNYALADTEFTRGCDLNQFRLTAGASATNNNNIAEFVGDDCAIVPAVGMDGNELPVVNPSGDGNASIKGKQFAFSPKHTFALFGNYRYPLTPSVGFFAGFDVSYESKKFAQIHNGAFVDAATLLGARLGLESEYLRLTLFGRNLTGEDAPIVVTRWVPPNFQGLPRAFFANPRRDRSIGLEVSLRF